MDPPAIQRQVAYDRLIERLYLIDDGWIVKGATALLAREIGVRGSIRRRHSRHGRSRVAASRHQRLRSRTFFWSSEKKLSMAASSATSSKRLQ